MVNIYNGIETLPNVEPTEEHDTILARILNGIREFDELLSDIQNNVYTVDDKVDTCTMLGKLNQILEYVKGLGIVSIAIDDNNQIVFTLKNGETMTTQPIQSGTNITINGEYVTSLSFDSNPQQQLDTQNTQITTNTNRLNTHDTMIGDIDDELNTQQQSINNLASNIQLINNRKINNKTFNRDTTLYGTDITLASDSTTTVTNAINNILNIVMPVGYVMCVRNNINYTNYCGFVWQKLPTDKVLWSASSVGTITEDTIEAGLPNIKGNLGGGGDYKFTSYSTTQNVKAAASGAFSTAYNTHVGGYGSGGGYSVKQDIIFNANSSNSIYKDNVTTVQPPAIKAVFWQRIG